jgi:hypothetical protein
MLKIFVAPKSVALTSGILAHRNQILERPATQAALSRLQ